MKNTYNSDGGDDEVYRTSGWGVFCKESRTENNEGYDKTYLSKLCKSNCILNFIIQDFFIIVAIYLFLNAWLLPNFYKGNFFKAKKYK